MKRRRRVGRAKRVPPIGVTKVDARSEAVTRFARPTLRSRSEMTCPSRRWTSGSSKAPPSTRRCRSRSSSTGSSKARSSPTIASAVTARTRALAGEGGRLRSLPAPGRAVRDRERLRVDGAGRSRLEVETARGDRGRRRRHDSAPSTSASCFSSFHDDGHGAERPVRPDRDAANELPRRAARQGPALDRHRRERAGSAGSESLACSARTRNSPNRPRSSPTSSPHSATRSPRRRGTSSSDWLPTSRCRSTSSPLHDAANPR